MDELFACHGLTKTYGGLTALNNVDLCIGSGKVVGLLGPNGSGKTTLLKLANGLLTPSTGEILIRGKKPGVESKALISYLPDASYLPASMTADRLVGMFEAFYRDFDRMKAEYLLAQLGIAQNAKLKHLSKGNQEKVQLILTMSRNAALYLLDEPIGGVDPAARDYILSTILTNRCPGSSVLISTHLIADVEPVLDDVIFLQYGNVVLYQPANDVRQEHGVSVDQYFREVFRC